MKYAYVLAAVAAVAHAQTRADIPKCALPCLDDAIPKASSCAVDDYPCVCKEENFSKIQAAALTCVTSKCTDLAAVVTAAQKLCAAQGKPKPSSSESTPASTPASTGSETGTATETPTETGTETAAPTTTAVEGTTTSCPTTMITNTPAVPVNGTQPAGGNPPQTTVPTGGAAAVGSIGAMAMAAIAALAL